MNFRTCNPLYGYRWFRQGFDLFVRQPWPWLALTGLAMLGTLVLVTLPLLGIIAVFLLLPGLTGGLLLAAQSASRGEPIMLPHLVAGYRQAARPLAALGGANLLLTVVGLFVIYTGWSEEFSKLLQLMNSETPDRAALTEAASQLTLPSLLSLAFMLPVSMANWFATALILFRNAAVSDAMRLSLWASLRNFWPFLVFGVLLFLLDALLSLVLQVFLRVLKGTAGATVADAATMMLTFPVLCAFFAILLGAMYVSYGDVFEAIETPTQP